MRLAVLAAACLATGSAALYADPARRVADGLAIYERICSAAITNPQGYVSSVPNPGPLGNRTISVSPDGQVINVSRQHDSYSEYVHFIRLPDSLTVSCMIHDSTQTMMTLQAQLGSPEAFSAYSQSLAQAIEGYAAARPGMTLVGGQVPLDEAMRFDGQIERMLVQDNYQYGYAMQAGDTRVPTLIEVTQGALTFHTVHRIDIAARPQAAQLQDNPPAALARLRDAMALCLRNYHDEASLPAQFAAAGFATAPGPDAGYVSFELAGVNGLFSAVPGQGYCSIQSTEVPLALAEQAGLELARSLFGDKVELGNPETPVGAPVPPCDGLSIFAARQLIRVTYSAAGNSGECLNDGTSAVQIKM